MSLIMTAAGATLAFVTVYPEGSVLATIGWIVAAALAGLMIVETFGDACSRRHGIGWLGSSWSGKKRYFLISGGCAVAGYFFSAARYPNSPDFALLSAWCSAGPGGLVAAALQQEAERPLRARYLQRADGRWRLHGQMELLADYLAWTLGRPGLYLACSRGGFDAADYRWWAANDADYVSAAHSGADQLIAGNWRIRYDGGDMVRTEFAGRSLEIYPRGLEPPRYAGGVCVGPWPPSDYQLAERLHRFLEVRRNWKLPTRHGGDLDLFALAATIREHFPGGAESPSSPRAHADGSLLRPPVAEPAARR